MGSRGAVKIAWSVCGLTLVLIACAVALAALNRADLWGLSYLAAMLLGAVVGGLVASSRPTNPVGWLIAGGALCWALQEFTSHYAIYGVLTEPGSLPAVRVMSWPPYWLPMLGVMLIFVFLPLYFPDGRLPSRRWRPVAWLAVFATAILALGLGTSPGDQETPGIPNPLGVEALQLPYAVDDVGMPTLFLGLGLISAMSLVVRFRRSQGEERQQIKWVAYAAVLAISFMFISLGIFLEGVFGWEEEFDVVFTVLAPVVFGIQWVAIAIAILRHRHYDLDLLINRTLVYGSLTATLVTVYFGGIVLLQRVFVVLTGEKSTLAVVASTLVIAALFNPLRRRIQSFIDRRFYRRKYDAAKTLAAFNARLRDETDLHTLTDDLVGVVKETMQPEHVSVWLRPDTASKKDKALG